MLTCKANVKTLSNLKVFNYQYRLELEKCRISGDSVFFEYPRFGIKFKGTFSAGHINGIWNNEVDQEVNLKEVDLVKRRPQTPMSPFSYISQEASFQSKDGLIHYTGALTLPNAIGKFPVVVLLTGSGTQDRDETIYYHKPFWVMADYLTKRGFVVLRMDDRGAGGTTGDDFNNTTSDFANDVLEAVRFLQTQNNIDSRSIGLIGHSEGAWIAFLAASRSSDIAYIVSFGGPGVSGKEIAINQMGYGLYANERDTVVVNNVSQFWSNSFDMIKNTADNRQVQSAISDIFKAWLKEYQNSSLELNLLGVNITDMKDETKMNQFLYKKMGRYLTPWYRYLLSYDPRTSISKLKTPILALNGDRDEQVDANDNLSRFKLMADGFGVQVDTLKFQNVNHFFQTNTNGSITEVYENPETISSAVLETIFKWIYKHK